MKNADNAQGPIQNKKLLHNIKTKNSTRKRGNCENTAKAQRKPRQVQ